MIAEKDLKGFLHLISLPQNVFFILGLFFGLLFVFVTPPAIVGDEPNHFFRAYQISEFHIFGEKRGDLSGGWIPKSVLYTNRKLVGDIEMNPDVKFDTKLLTELRQFPLNPNDKVFERFPNTVIYTPIPYIPQVLGVIIGKTFDVSALTLIYFARVVNLLFFLVLAYLAIIKTPVHKWAFCFLSLTPTNVFQVSSASVDAFTYGICFLTISYFLYFAFGAKEKLEKSDLIKIFFLSLSAVLCKQAYLLLPLLFLLIPVRKFVSMRRFWITFSGLIVCCFGAVVAWALAIKSIYLPYRIDIPINPDEQTAFIISHPLIYLKILVNDYIIHSSYYFITFFGQLVWFDLYVPTFLTIVLFIVLLIIALADKDHKISISNISKLLFSFIVTATLILISTLLYMTWSPIGGEMIEGVQGRYFIPVAPLFFLLFYNKKLKWKFFESYIYIFIYFTVIISLLITLKTVIDRYYV